VETGKKEMKSLLKRAEIATIGSFLVLSAIVIGSFIISRIKIIKPLKDFLMS